MSDRLVPRKLRMAEARGMTVNERLWHAGLIEGFDEAVRAGDAKELRRILKAIYIDESDIEAIIFQSLGRE